MAGVPMRPTLAQLLPEVPAELASIAPNQLTLDSRQVAPGDAFVALPGRASDGRRFIDDALARGASVVLAEAGGLDAAAMAAKPVLQVAALGARLGELARDFYADPSASMALMAVTGTNGKTSVVDFIGQISRALGIKTGCIGTLGSRLGNDLGEAANTTPDVFSLNRQLADWLAEGVDHVAMEASSHALDQGRLDGLTIHSAVFTNLSRDHLDYHGSEQAYAEAKLSLFTRPELKRALFNADDALANSVRAVSACPSMSISLSNPEADVYVQVLSHRPLTLRLHTPTGTADLSADLSGSFNAFNLAAAIMTVASLGYSFDDVVHAAQSVAPVPGRMQTLAGEHDFSVVVDYAHTPDALERALAALRPTTSGALWVVFGCGGDRDTGKRALMGEIASSGADEVVVTSDNPRSESPDAIVSAILAGCSEGAHAIVDRRAAIEFALSQARSGDTVLIAGKGHEHYQEVNGTRSPFNDLDVARDWLQREGVGRD